MPSQLQKINKKEMLQKVVFLDRDGVINKDSPDYIKSWSEFEFLSGSLEAIKLLTLNGFATIIITNQSVINRKMASGEVLDYIHTMMIETVKSRGGEIKDIFFCPHTPKDRCDCRKPSPGLIFKAKQKYRIDLATSVMVGDSVKDIECARNAGCRQAVLVKTGGGAESEKILKEKAIYPDHIARDLLEAVEWIITHDKQSAIFMNKSLPITTLEGCLERITYFNAENHYTIAKLKISKTNNLVTVVGTMAAANPGQTLKIQGTWETHPKYGQQLKIKSYEIVLPATIDGIRKYLGSGIIKGIGPSMANRMVRCFGSKTFEIIEKHPEKLLEVKGIGKAKAALICNAWKDHHVARGLMQFLQSMGVQTSYCAKILKEYGTDAVNIISKDPFRMTTDIPGIGLHFADTIAHKLGVKKDQPRRVMACIIHVMQQFANQGDVFAYEDQLVERCKNLFQIKPSVIRNEICTLSASGELVVENAMDDRDKKIVYLKEIHQAETGIANRLKALLSVPIIPPDIDTERISTEVQKKLAITLSSEQLNVLEEILSHRAVIITGGHGTGKTTLIRSINAVF